MPLKAALFDLDGVIVRTDALHYRSWKKLTEEEKIPFDETVNQRLRGVSRMKSLEIILEKTNKVYSPAEKEKLAARKNDYYNRMLDDLSGKDVLPGALELISELKREKIPVALCSGSKNARRILEQLKITGVFDTVIDGYQISRTKPDPEIFLLAAKRLRVPAEGCLVFEDAPAGIEAARRAGMKSVGIGKKAFLDRADLVVSGLDEIDLAAVKEVFAGKAKKSCGRESI